MKIVIPGNPIAKKRPRFYRRGKGVGVYNDQQTEEGKALLLAIDQITEKFTGAVCADFMFEFARPKSHYGTGRNAGKLKPSAPKHHLVKPDKSNCEKFYEDILNGVAWDDDRQIIFSISEKRWAIEDPKTTIFIY